MKGPVLALCAFALASASSCAPTRGRAVSVSEGLSGQDFRMEPAVTSPTLVLDRRDAPAVRALVTGYLRSLRDRGATLDETNGAAVVRALHEFRAGPPGPIQVSPLGSVSEGPFLNLLVGEKLPDIYAAEYEANWNSELAKAVNNVPLEPIYDAFMEGIAAGTLVGAMKKAGDQVGVCLAKRVLKGRPDAKSGRTCDLDLDEGVEQVQEGEPGFFSLASAAISCKLKVFRPSPCETRRLIFRAAKAQLIEARKSPAVREEVRRIFTERFPKEFREKFMAELSTQTRQAPKLMASKFSAPVDERLFSAPAVEGVAPDGTFKLVDLASGLEAESISAAALAARRSDSLADREARGASAALLYAAANRVLFLQGGREASFENGSFVVDPMSVYDPAQPAAAPRLLKRAFGGWGVSGTTGTCGEWDWLGYDPAVQLRVFPETFKVGARGVGKSDPQATETLDGIARLLTSMNEFLVSTSTKSTLAPHFGSDEEVSAAILDEKSPLVFPARGRMLAVGVIAAALKNLGAPGVGHLEKRDPTTRSDAGLGLVIFDRLSTQGRAGGPVSVEGMARLLVALSDLQSTLPGDPAVPSEMLAALPQFDGAIQVGALTLSAQAQRSDGGFAPVLGDKTQASKLSESVWSMRALSRSYSRSRAAIHKLSLRDAWLYLDGVWSPSLQVTPEQAWDLIRLWDDTQSVVRPDLVDARIDWEHWARRFAALRADLESRVSSAISAR